MVCVICKNLSNLVKVVSYAGDTQDLLIRDYIYELLDSNFDLDDSHQLCIVCLKLINNLLFIKRHIIDKIQRSISCEPFEDAEPFYEIYSTFMNGLSSIFYDKKEYSSIRYDDDDNNDDDDHDDNDDRSLDSPETPHRGGDISPETPMDRNEDSPMMQQMYSETFKPLTEKQELRERRKFSKQLSLARHKRGLNKVRATSEDREVLKIFKRKKRRGHGWASISKRANSRTSLKSASRNNVVSRPPSSFSITSAYSCQTTFYDVDDEGLEIGKSKEFLCDVDNCFSATKYLLDDLIKHKVEEHGFLDKFWCEECYDKKYTSRKELNIHIMQVHNISINDCPYCMKELRTNTAYYRHLFEHSLKSFPCKFCDRSYTDAISCIDHVRTDHKGEKSNASSDPKTRTICKYRNVEKMSKKDIVGTDTDKEVFKIRLQVGGEDCSNLTRHLWTAAVDTIEAEVDYFEDPIEESVIYGPDPDSDQTSVSSKEEPNLERLNPESLETARMILNSIFDRACPEALPEEENIQTEHLQPQEVEISTEKEPMQIETVELPIILENIVVKSAKCSVTDSDKVETPAEQVVVENKKPVKLQEVAERQEVKRVKAKTIGDFSRFTHGINYKERKRVSTETALENGTESDKSDPAQRTFRTNISEKDYESLIQKITQQQQMLQKKESRFSSEEKQHQETTISENVKQLDKVVAVTSDNNKEENIDINKEPGKPSKSVDFFERYDINSVKNNGKVSKRRAVQMKQSETSTLSPEVEKLSQDEAKCDDLVKEVAVIEDDSKTSENIKSNVIECETTVAKVGRPGRRRIWKTKQKEIDKAVSEEKELDTAVKVQHTTDEGSKTKVEDLVNETIVDNSKVSENPSVQKEEKVSKKRTLRTKQKGTEETVQTKEDAPVEPEARKLTQDDAMVIYKGLKDFFGKKLNNTGTESSPNKTNPKNKAMLKEYYLDASETAVKPEVEKSSLVNEEKIFEAGSSEEVVPKKVAKPRKSVSFAEILTTEKIYEVESTGTDEEIESNLDETGSAEEEEAVFSYRKEEKKKSKKRNRKIATKDEVISQMCKKSKVSESFPIVILEKMQPEVLESLQTVKPKRGHKSVRGKDRPI